MENLKQNSKLLELLTEAVTSVDASEGSILLASGKQLVFHITTSSASDVLLGTALPASSGLVGLCFQFQQPTLTNGVKDDPAHDSSVDTRTGHTTEQQIAVPLSTPLREWGCMTAINSKHGNFSVADLETYIDKAEAIAACLDQIDAGGDHV